VFVELAAPVFTPDAMLLLFALPFAIFTAVAEPPQPNDKTEKTLKIINKIIFIFSLNLFQIVTNYLLHQTVLRVWL